MEECSVSEVNYNSFLRYIKLNELLLDGDGSGGTNVFYNFLIDVKANIKVNRSMFYGDGNKRYTYNDIVIINCIRNMHTNTYVYYFTNDFAKIFEKQYEIQYGKNYENEYMDDFTIRINRYLRDI